MVWRKICWVLEYQGFLRSIMIKLPPDCVIGSTRKFRGAAHTSMIQLDQVILLAPTSIINNILTLFIKKNIIGPHYVFAIIN